MALAGSWLIVSLAGQILSASKAEKGNVTWPHMGPASIFSKASRIPRARFTQNASFSHWGTIGRLGELIFMIENLIK